MSAAEPEAIRYLESAFDISAAQLHGFFEGWPRRPTPEVHLRLLRQSDGVVLAVDDDSGAVVGFVTAISDGVLAAYIPLLEVLQAYRGRGIGKELVRRMLGQLEGLYMVDVVCDAELLPFYESMGMRRGYSAMGRRYEFQGGGKGAE